MKLLSLTKKMFPEWISAILLFLFLYTSVSKLLNWTAFQHTLSYAPVVAGLSLVLSWIIPLGEIFIAVLLFFGRTKLWGLYGSIFLLVVFTLYIIYLLLFVPNLPCSCGGILQQLSWNQHLVLNLILIVMTMLGALLERERRYEHSPRKLLGVE